MISDDRRGTSLSSACPANVVHFIASLFSAFFVENRLRLSLVFAPGWVSRRVALFCHKGASGAIIAQFALSLRGSLAAFANAKRVGGEMREEREGRLLFRVRSLRGRIDFCQMTDRGLSGSESGDACVNSPALLLQGQTTWAWGLRFFTSQKVAVVSFSSRKPFLCGQSTDRSPGQRMYARFSLAKTID